MDLTKCFTNAAGRNWIGKCVLYHIAMYAFARGSHTVGERHLPLPVLKGRKTEKGDICNFITTLMGFSIIQELHFLMHWAHKYKVQ